MRILAALACLLMLGSTCNKDVNVEAPPFWWVDPTRAGADEQPVLAPRPGQTDVPVRPRIRWYYAQLDPLEFLSLKIEERDAAKPVLSVADTQGLLKRKDGLDLFAPPAGVALEVHDASQRAGLKPGTWYVLSIYAGDVRTRTQADRLEFRTAKP